MNELKKHVRQYWNWRSESYGVDSDKSLEVSERWRSVINELLENVDGRRALDIGTGTGQFALYLAGAGFDVTGIDLSENMISCAKKNAAESMADIDFRTGDAENTGFADNSFDVVVSRNLIWTLPDPEKAIKEWYRILKPDGKIIVSDGFWKNHTWKQIHHIGWKLLKGILMNGSMTSLRFFTNYAGVRNHLPLYEGVQFKDADKLMQNAKFKDIKSYDVKRFEVNPYGGDNRSFFIAHAYK